MAGKHYSMARV